MQQCGCTQTPITARRSRIENCLVSVLALGISCSKKQIRERTKMQDAAVEINCIRDSYLRFASSPMVEHRGLATTLQ
jgi:hypothetical protein